MSNFCVTHPYYHERGLVKRPKKKISRTFDLCAECEELLEKEPRPPDCETKYPPWAMKLLADRRRERRQEDEKTGPHRFLPPEEADPFEEHVGDDEDRTQEEALAERAADPWPDLDAVGQASEQDALVEISVALEQFETVEDILWAMGNTPDLTESEHLALYLRTAWHDRYSMEQIAQMMGGIKVETVAKYLVSALAKVKKAGPEALLDDDAVAP